MEIKTASILLFFVILGVNGCNPSWYASPPSTPVVAAEAIGVLSATNVNKLDATQKSSGVSNSHKHHGTSHGKSTSGNRGRISISATELRKLSEQLLSEDINNVGHLLQTNFQGKTTSAANNDMARLPLFKTIPKAALEGPTVTKLINLLDNYIPKVQLAEVENNIEHVEKEAFLDAVMDTNIMKTTETFLKNKGFINRSLRNVLDEIWFDLYGRSGRIQGSSGFEHVFIGELKKGKVSGFHNWVTFIHEEQEQDLDYQGFMKYVNLNGKGVILKLRFNWMHDKKPVGSIFIGTSPELEMALYTVCFYARSSSKCPMSLNGKRFNIQTYPYKVGAKNLIGSAYPDI